MFVYTLSKFTRLAEKSQTAKIRLENQMFLSGFLRYTKPSHVLFRNNKHPQQSMLATINLDLSLPENPFL